MWNTALTRLLGIKYPIIQAPMSGGPATAQLAAAVSNAGGLGSLGCGYAAPEQIGAEIRAARKLTDKPFSVGLFTAEETTASRDEIWAASKLLNKYRQELGLPLDPPLPAQYAVRLADQLQVILQEKPAVFCFTFGVPPEGFLRECRRLGIRTMGTATRPQEVRAMRDTLDQVDFVFAQGIEAGGHRGNTATIPNDPCLGLLPLIPQLLREKIPVIAAGGMMDGRQIAGCLAMGACGVSLGTAFLLCPEAGTSAPYRAALRGEAAAGGSTARGTELTRLISGRPARGIRNRFMEEMKQFDGQIPPYPYQNALTSELRKACAAAGKSDLLSLWAGQGVDRIREMPAGELLAVLVTEAERAGVKAQ